jgi:hypothetical protein
MKSRVLWIEDGALDEMSKYYGPLFNSGKYDIIVAFDATEGERQLMMPENEFASVIVDIRIPPGSGKNWSELFNRLGSDKIQARLGMHLLYSIFNPSHALIKLEQPIPNWVKPTKFGIFTVETANEVGDDIKELGIIAFTEKSADESSVPLTALIDLIEQIEKQK